MKSHGFCFIYNESFNTISTNRKLFTQIAIFLSLPATIISVTGAPLASLLYPDVSIVHFSSSNNLPVSLWTIIAFLVFRLAYTILSIGFSLLSFSSVTYSVACIYTEHTNITFKTTICAFKKAWKKLVLTWLAELTVILGCTLLMGLVTIAFTMVLTSEFHKGYTSSLVIGSLAIFVITIVFSIGIVYLSIIWIYGCTVAVLETSYGFKALSKSKSLIKGKAFLTIKVFLPISLCSFFVAWIFLKVVMNGELIGLGLLARIGCGVVALPVMVCLVVFTTVAQTMTYLVCKEDKDESITKSNVMDHLDIYVDGYSPLTSLKANDEQI